MFLPPIDFVHQTLGHRFVTRTGDQQVFSADQFGGLAEYRRAPVSDHAIGECTDQRIRSPSRMAIAAAALQSESKVASRDRGSRILVGDFKHCFQMLLRAIDRRSRAAFGLHGQHRRRD